MQSVPLSPVPSEKLLGPGHGPSVWPLRERLALASALLDVDNQQNSWFGISRQLSRFTTPGRPESWCSAKACAKQYALLLDAVELTRRQKTPAELSRVHFVQSATPPASQSVTPGLSVAERLVKRLTVERVDELRNRIRLGQKYYSFLKQFLVELESGKLDSHIPKLENVVGLHTSSQICESNTQTGESSVGRSSNTHCTRETGKLVNEFTQLWNEIDNMYKVPESTWICPPGPGTAAANTTAVSGSGASSGANGPKASGTGSGSSNRLNTLLAEASSVIQTPSHHKTPTHDRNGRRRVIGLNKANNDSTATTRAAVATRQRYLANATKKQRMALRTKAKRKFGRSGKDSIVSLRSHSKASDQNRSRQQQSGSYSHHADSVDETTDEHYSSDITDTRQLPPHLTGSGASTPSTTAMCLSDTEDQITMDTQEQEAEPVNRSDELASTTDGGDTSPGAVSSDHGRTMSMDEEGSTSDRSRTADADDEPITPAMSASSPSSQATEAASHQGEEEAEYSEGELSDTLVAQSPALAENEMRANIESDRSAHSNIIDSVPEEEQSRVVVESVVESKLVHPTTSENVNQSLTRTESNEQVEVLLPFLAIAENDITIMTSIAAHSDTNEGSHNKDSPLGSPAVFISSENQSGESGSTQQIADEIKPSVPVWNTEVDQHISLDSTGVLPPSDKNDIEMQVPSDRSGEPIRNSPAEQLFIRTQSSDSRISSDEQSLISNSNHMMSSSDVPLADTGPIGLSSSPESLLSHSVVHLPKSASNENSPLNVMRDITLSPPSNRTPITELISQPNSPPCTRRESPATHRDAYHVPSSSTPSGKELAVELSPANLSHLAAYNSCVLLEPTGFVAPSPRDDGEYIKSSGSKSHSRSKSKSKKKNRTGKHRKTSSHDYDSQLLSLSKGSPVVELSNLMLSMPSSPDSVKPANVSVNLHATVSLEPINFPCSSEYPGQEASTDGSPPVQQPNLSSNRLDTSPAHPSIRIRLCRHGSQLAVVSDSHPLPHSDWTAVFDANADDDEPVASWCHRVLSAAETALYDLCNDFWDQLHAERHYPAHSVERGRVAVQSILDSIRFAVDNRQFTDEQSLTHQLLASLARLVMTHSSHSTTFLLARHVYKCIEPMLFNHGTDVRHSEGSSTTAIRQRSSSPSSDLAYKRARKKTRLL